MTCVLTTTPWHHFNDHIPWLPMKLDSKSSEESHSHGYSSPGSDTKKSSMGSGKKRASRAGTRSVTTLSAAQLERKRANDREAQRAIRQRTKEHIDHLERSINDLRGTKESTEKLCHATQQRNRELEEENAYLRSKLNEAGFNLDILAAQNQRDSEPPLLSIPSSSPGASIGSGIPRPNSTSTPSTRSTTAQSRPQHESWQHQATGFVSTSNNAIGLPSATAIAGGPNMSAWRSHESGPTLQDPMQTPASSAYPQDQRMEWSGNAANYQHYVSQEQQRPAQYETATSQQPAYQPSVPGYSVSSATQQPTYHHTSLPSQNEFPSMSAPTSAAPYQVQVQPGLQQTTSFSVAPMPVSAGGSSYSSPHGPMQPPPLPGSSFPDPTYNTQPPHATLAYRDEAADRSYSMAHYPTA